MEEHSTVASPVLPERRHRQEESHAPPLLREWNYPPVAPAVVLPEESTTTTTTTTTTTNANTTADATNTAPSQQQQRHPEASAATATATAHHSNSSSYSYPVATFVRDLVRTSIYAGPEVTAAAAAAATSHDDDDSVRHLSVRSEADAQALRTATAAAENEHPSATAVSARDFDGDIETEFILVDGDLIAIPPDPPNEEEREEYEYQLRSQVKTCQPNRVRRGVRRIYKKFFRRKQKDQQQHPQPQQQQPPQQQQKRRGGAGAAPASSAASASSASVPAAAAAAPVVLQPLRAQPTRDGQHERAARLAGVPAVAAAAAAAAREVSQNGLVHVAAPDAAITPQASSSPKRRGFLGRKRRSWRRSDSGDADGNNQECGPRSAVSADPPAAPDSLSVRSNNSGGLVPAMERIDEDGHQCSATARAQSVTASFLGTADQLLEAGVLPAGMDAVAYVECDSDILKKDDDDTIVASVVPRDADYKVDKADAPDVESMLRRAQHETCTDLELSEASGMVTPPPQPPRSRRSRGKSDGSAVPLSAATRQDVRQAVYNDVLKVVMVGSPPGEHKSWLARALRNSNKRPRKRTTLGVDVHTWTPTTEKKPTQTQQDQPAVRFQIWDVQGANSNNAQNDITRANFGAHFGTQSLFFSAQSLYLLVWDLAGTNRQTFREPSRRRFASTDTILSDDDDEAEEDDEYDDFLREEAGRQADRALHADISSRVLSWVDCIASRGAQSAILPVAVIPQGMSPSDVKRRCDMMQNLLEEHVQRFVFSGDDRTAPKLLTGADNIISVEYATGYGVQQLQETVQAIATDSQRLVFDHVGTPVPPGTVEVLDTVRRLKQSHKLILLDHLLAELGSGVPLQRVVDALHFLSSTGEILYFGTADDDVLSRYIILSRKWLVSALSCILRNDLKRELKETRRFMNMQCIYSNQKFPENEITAALVSSTAESSCPLLSAQDANMLWQSMSFMREAADRSLELAESSTTAPTMFSFLQRLLVHSGIFMPLRIQAEGDGCLSTSLMVADHHHHHQQQLCSDEVYFVPSLLAQADPRDVWTFKTQESWMTTLCHSWLFRDGAPSDLMERVAVNLLRDLYQFSRDFKGMQREAPHRAQTVPVGRSALHSFLLDHDKQAIGRIKIHQVMCWKSSLLARISTVFCDQEKDELRESFVEIFVTVVDQSSRHCVSSDAMRASMHRVVVSGKGQVGQHGRKLWQGGYRVVLESVRATLKGNAYANVDNQVVCPECLAHISPANASTWSWDSVRAAAESGSSVVRCMRGHRIDSNLICGTCRDPESVSLAGPATESSRPAKPVPEMLPSVVLVGLWDARSGGIVTVGSGFVVDKKLGLVVTAGHVLFNMEEGRQFGTPYLGLKDAKVVVGVIPEDDDGRHNAVFRYFAEIVMDDIHNVDACVVRLVSRMERDVTDNMACADQAERVLDPSGIHDEKLRSLKLTSRFELEESVRVLGFNQGGEGVLEKGKHVNRSADFAKGYICKKFKAFSGDDSVSSHSSDSSSSSTGSHLAFSPREEIVIMCYTISGHSGGPCVNEEGKVVGILSRADPVDRQRCYLVPAHELKLLVFKARKRCLSSLRDSHESPPKKAIMAAAKAAASI